MSTDSHGRKLTRRDFLRVTAAGAGLAVTGAIAGCAQPQPAASTPAAPAAAPAATTASAAAPAQASSSKTKITFGWTWGTAAQMAEELVKRFNDQSKTIEVEFQIVPYDQVLPKLQTAFSSGAGPDCLSITSSWSAALAGAKYLEDLEPRVKAAGLDKQLTPIAFSTGKAYKDTLYYIGFMVDVYSLYYNKKLFEEAGIKQPPATIDEFHEVARKLTNPAKGQYGTFAPGAAAACDRYYFTWAFGYGGLGQKAVNKSLFDDKNKVIMGSPKHIEGLAKWLELYQKDKVMPEAAAAAKAAELDNAFGSGKIGMAFTWLGGIGTWGKALGQDNIGTAPAPEGPAGRVACCGTNGYSLNANSKNKDAAWEFLTWLLGQEANTAITKSWGSIPTNLQALQDPFVNSPLLTAPKQMASLEAQYYPPRHLAAYGKFFEQVGPELCQKAMLGQITAQQWGEGIAKYYNDAVVAEGAA